ncbi:ABC transporter ATP-binding protein [Thermoproteota archaeon]
MNNEPLLKVTNLKKLFQVRSGIVESIFSRKKKRFLHAVDGITFNINYGETLGIAGESGCGKTTTGMLLALLETPTDGTIMFKGVNILSLKKRELQDFRRSVQMIFQDPYESLDPRLKAFDAVYKPLAINHIGTSRNERAKMVDEMLEEVELKPVKMFRDKYPHELSGGQRQRVAIARAMVVKPDFIVADEPVSMLDASVKVGIMDLMSKLRKDFDTTYLFITHDLSVSRYLSDRIMIMYLGVIVEIGFSEDIISNSQHPYTKLLMSSVPVPDPTYDRKRMINSGEIPSPIDLSPGCRFQSRCLYSKEKCKQAQPRLQEIGKNHFVACHLHDQ